MKLETRLPCGTIPVDERLTPMQIWRMTDTYPECTKDDSPHCNQYCKSCGWFYIHNEKENKRKGDCYGLFIKEYE